MAVGVYGVVICGAVTAIASFTPSIARILWGFIGFTLANTMMYLHTWDDTVMSEAHYKEIELGETYAARMGVHLKRWIVCPLRNIF